MLADCCRADTAFACASLILTNGKSKKPRNHQMCQRDYLLFAGKGVSAMSETECEYCGGRYRYFQEQLRPDGTVSCQNCGRPIENPIIIQGEPMTEIGMPFFEWFRESWAPGCLVSIIGFVLFEMAGGFDITAFPYGIQTALFVLVIAIVVSVATKPRNSQLQEASPQNDSTSP